MVIAGFVNAAAAFHASGNQHVAEIETAYRTLEPLVGKAAILVMSQVALSFGIALAIIPLVLFTASSDIIWADIPTVKRLQPQAV